jgi:hypothetical protein
MARKKTPWSKAQLATLHKCWKEAGSRQEFLTLVSERLAEIPPPVAWSLVRKLSRSDREWEMTARQKERDKEERRLAKERHRQDRLRRRDERQKVQQWKEQREVIRKLLSDAYADLIAKAVGMDFFFCPDMRQHVCRLTCVFRVFSGEGTYGFSHGGPCEKCERMDEHIPALEEILRRPTDEKQKSRRDKTGSQGSQTRAQDPASGPKTATGKTAGHPGRSAANG